MITSKKLRYFIFVSLVITMPVHPKNLFNYCTDAFQLTKQSVVDVVNGEATTRTKIVVGAALLSISSLVIYMVIKHTKKEAPAPKRQPTPADLEREADKAFFWGKGIGIYSISGKHLIKAINDNDKELILMLLKYDIRVASLNEKFDDSPLAVAIMKDPALVDFLLKNAKKVDQDIIKEAIFFAIKKGRLFNTLNKSLQILFKHTEDPYVFLYYAALHNTNALKLLIQQGELEGNLTQGYFDDALRTLARELSNKEQRKGMKILVKHGANVNRTLLVQGAHFSDPIHKQVRTPLSEAVSRGSAWTVEFLLRHGAQLLDSKTNISAYDYFKDIPNTSSKELKRRILDNHRRKLVKDYYDETCNELYTHGLTEDTLGIVTQYITPSYPLKTEYPLTSFEIVADYYNSDSDDDN